MGLRGPRLACDRCGKIHGLGCRPENVSARYLWIEAATCGWELVGRARLCRHCVGRYRQLAAEMRAKGGVP